MGVEIASSNSRCAGWWLHNEELERRQVAAWQGALRLL